MPPLEMIANRYRIERLLGAGAMGQVLLVRDTSTDQDLALKLIQGEVVPGSAVGTYPGTAPGDTKGLLQFKQEFRLMAQLHHPNCCRVHDYGHLADGTPYFTMELVPGRGFDELKPLHPAEFKPLLAQLLLALGYIHQLGFVHCDLKGANVRVMPDSTVKLMDYGLMEYAGRPAATIRGTVPYLSPEMIKRGPIDQRSDLYSLGCLAYEMLAGRVPFQSDRAIETLRAHVNDEPEPLERLVPGIDAELARTVMKLLAKDPMRRFQSAAEVLEALGRETPPGIGGNLLASPIMGRDAELDRLSHGLEATACGVPGRTLAVWGASGIGKTRLLEEFRFRAQLADIPCLVGNSMEQKPHPYGPWVAVLRQLVPLAREVAPGALAEFAPFLAKLMPIAGFEPAPDLDTGRQEALRLHVAAVGLVLAIAAQTPLVLVLEDWHWSDPSSRELLDALQRNRGDHPVMVVVTSRMPPDATNKLADADEIALASLPPTGLAGMVASMLGSDQVNPAFLATLGTLTEGNPFYVERLLEHLVTQGVLVRQQGRWVTDVALDEGLAGTMRDLVLEKLQGLSPETDRLARTMAVLGRPARLGLLKHASGLADEDLIVGIHELGLAKMIAEDEGDTYRFVQAQFHHMLYTRLSDGERAQRHGAVLAALELEVGGRPVAQLGTERVTELALHGLKGAQPHAAIDYALEAGRRHARLYAMEEADRLLTTGLELVERYGAQQDRARAFAYLRGLGEVRRQAGKAKEAAALLERALETATGRPRMSGPFSYADTLVPAADLGRLLTSLAKAYQVQGLYPQAIAAAERSEGVCLEVGDEPGAGRAALTLARIRFYQGQGDAAVADAERSLALVAPHQEKGLTGIAQAFLGYLYVTTRPERLDAGVQLLHDSLLLLLEAGDKPGLNDSYNLLGNAQNLLGNFRDAWTAFAESAKVCREIGFREDEAVAMVNLALTAIELGDWPAAREQAVAARELAEGLGAKLPWSMGLAMEAAALANLGPLAPAAGLAAQAVAMARGMGNKYLESLALAQQIEVLVALGRLAAAQAACDMQAALITATNNQECAGRLAAAQAEVAARQGLHGIAREHAAVALEAARASGALGQEVQALRVQARIELLAGETEAARGLARTALDLAERLGCQAQRADILAMLGEAAGDAGAVAYFAAMPPVSPVLEARSLFGRAVACPNDPGSAELAARARALLVDLTADLDEAGRHEFLMPRERRRVMEGAFAAAPKRKVSTAPLRPGFGGLQF
ncbi:MAG: Serine/threonine protein kinase [Cyanobacteria bacterium RYN_339]|nr:Serine/threonine protein kinase [Cyanobacteria bacterium RYN_339]